MRLYLIRHAQTAWNAEGRAQGHADIPLDSTGESQAETLRDAMKGIGLAAVYSSDLIRCRQTAEHVAEATGGELRLDVRIRERLLGEFEGALFDDFREQMTARQSPNDPYGTLVRPEGGESTQDVWDRLAPFVEEVKRIHEPIAIVSHGGACALLLSQLLNGDPLTARSFRFGNAAITELSRNHQGLFVMERYNDTAHLTGLRVLTGNLDGAHR